MRLQDVCVSMSSNIAQKDIKDCIGNYPIYGASGLIGNVDYYKQEAPYIGIVKDGAGVGRVYILPAKSSVIGTMQYIIPNNNIDLNYLYYALQHMHLEKYSTGATIPHIYFRDYQFEPISLPTLHEQRRKSSILQHIDKMISIRSMQVEIMDTLVKSRFVEMFGEPVTNPMGWEKAPLADKCDIVTGNTPSRNVKEYYGDAIEWIKSDNITEATILTTAAEYLSEKGVEVGRTAKAGSILMTCIAGSLRSIGNVAIADRKVAFNQQINAILPREQNTYFMYEQFRLSKEYICSGVNMALKGILSKGQLSEIEFVFPPITLQNQFADFVALTDKSKLAVQQSIDTLQTLKSKLMQDYFG
ncbi:MAG: restriction endonuclease subunit S [Selenomonas ruminantium]|nr:restriction endonuclease subunit S [Selenomonas ruminantium]